MTERRKTSSKAEERFVAYQVRGIVHYDGWQPETVEVCKGKPESEFVESQLALERIAGEKLPYDYSREGGYIAGTMAKRAVNQSGWTVPPHLALANLPSYDETGKMRMTLDESILTELAKLSWTEVYARKPALQIDSMAVVKFVKEYGLLHSRDAPDVSPGTPLNLSFREQLSSFGSVQELLRRAWAGSGDVIDCVLESEIEDGFEVRSFEILQDFAVGREGEVLLETEDLWKFICFLFLVDYAKGRTGVCANPDCLAPYFLRRKKDQVVCEQGECTKWAQRQYALRWWNKEGRKRRAKKQSARNRKFRKKSE